MKRGEIWQVNLDPTIGAEIQKSCKLNEIEAALKAVLKI